MINPELSILLEPNNLTYSKNDLEKEIIYYKHYLGQSDELKDIIINDVYIKTSLWSYVNYLYDKEVINERTDKFLFIQELFNKYNLITEIDYIGNFYFSGDHSLKLTKIFLNIANHQKLLNINNSVFNNDEKYLISYFFLKGSYLPSIKKDANNEEHINILFSFIAENKDKLKKKLNVDEINFCKLLFNSKYMPIVPKYIHQKVWHDLNLEKKAVMSLMFKNNNKTQYYNDYPNWINYLINFYNAKDLIKQSYRYKKFSPFKFFGYKLELATGYAIPQQYNKNIVRKHPYNTPSYYHIEALEKQFIHFENNIKATVVEENELKDWYIYLIIGGIKSLFILTTKTMPLTDKQLEDNELRAYINRKITLNEMSWKDLYDKIALEEKLNNELVYHNKSNSKMKI